MGRLKMSWHAKLLHTSNALVGSLCAVILGLASHCIVLQDRLESSGSPSPSYVKTVGLSLLMWAGVGGVFDALLLFVISTIFASREKRDANTKKGRTWLLSTLLFIASFIVVRPFIILVYDFVEFGQAVKHQQVPREGYLTVESWACALADASGDGNARALCSEAHAARYMLVPTLVLGMIVLASMVWIRWRGLQGNEARKSAQAT